jgi:MFS transporter, DHA1 family, tetracycline resistance protein
LPAEKRRAFEWVRANPFGTFKVFQSYKGVMPLCVVMFLYFFASAVYPAIWPFWSIAKFGWSELVIGLTLAAFGIVTAVFQGVLTGPAEKKFGASTVVVIGLASSVIAVIGYGFAPGIIAVVVLFIIHGPEGLVHPMLSALMSKAVPENAQGELQGGISSIMSVAMLVGTVFFAQVFSWFMLPNMIWQSPDVAMFTAAGFLALTMLVFLRVRVK